jgi:hypothetical protein
MVLLSNLFNRLTTHEITRMCLQARTIKPAARLAPFGFSVGHY